MITVINKNLVPSTDGMLTEESLSSIAGKLEKKEKILVYINRRGAYKAFVCKDCSHIWKCPSCDVSFTEHISPKRELVCHHCMEKQSIPTFCPNCGGNHLSGVGIATQAIEDWLRRKFPEAKIHRLDSDQKNIQEAEIFISTEYALRKLHASIGLVIFVHPENELNIPEFDAEERLYTHIRAFSALAPECIIETYAPKLPIITDCLSGNYKSFLERMLRERKVYRYPPYTGLAYIQIEHTSVSKIEDIGAKLLNKLQISSSKTDSVLYDRGIRTKRAGKYIDTIMLRSDALEKLVAEIQKEIVKNPCVSLDIRGKKIL